jgi:NAD-dependent DNA ligase
MENLQGTLNSISEGIITPSTISDIRGILNEANRAYASGEPIIEDSIYDSLRDTLASYDPEDSLVKETWEQSSSEPDDAFKIALRDHGYLLHEHPMFSIKTVKSVQDPYYIEWIDSVVRKASTSNIQLHMSYKINGHGIRVVYDDGVLVSATTRARGGHGEDILPLISNIIPNKLPSNVEAPTSGTIELRGELCLPLSNLPKAREYNTGIKSALSAVTSLKAATDPEVQKLLTVLFYGYYNDSEILFDSKTQEYNSLSELGFDVPMYTTVNIEQGSDFDTVESIIQSNFQEFEATYDAFGYFCDGVVVTFDDSHISHDCEIDGSYSKSSMALKIGTWRQTGYVGKIESFKWIPGKTVLNPVAVVSDPNDGSEEGVLVAEGFRVKNIPLYNPSVIFALQLDINSFVHFNFGGESGVVPTYENGELVTSK